MRNMLHICERNERRELKDARGIFCGFVCDKCEAEKRSHFRPEIFADSQYECCEMIDEE